MEVCESITGHISIEFKLNVSNKVMLLQSSEEGG